MPSATKHRSWAARNEEFFGHLEGSDSQWSDWAMTALFYAAVHEISAFIRDHEAELAPKNLSFPESHKCMKFVLRDVWPELAPWYSDLLDKSYQARYKCREYEKADLESAHIKLRMLRSAIEALG